MSQITDENGTWEVVDGDGCTNKCLIQPSEQYLADNPIVVQLPSLNDRLSAVESAIIALMGV